VKTYFPETLAWIIIGDLPTRIETKNGVLVRINCGLEKQWAYIDRKIRHGIHHAWNIKSLNRREFFDQRLRLPVKYRPGATIPDLIESLKRSEREAIRPHTYNGSEDQTELISDLDSRNLAILVEEESARSNLLFGRQAVVKLGLDLLRDRRRV
jgi:hypothetical protein